MGRVRDKVSKQKKESLVCFTFSVFVPASWYQTKHAGVLYSIKPHRFPLFQTKAICQTSEACLGDMPKSWLICQNPG